MSHGETYDSCRNTSVLPRTRQSNTSCFDFIFIDRSANAGMFACISSDLVVSRTDCNCLRKPGTARMGGSYWPGYTRDPPDWCVRPLVAVQCRFAFQASVLGMAGGIA